MTSSRAPSGSNALLGLALSVAAPFAGAAESPSQQIARAGTGVADGDAVTWLEQVSDAQYREAASTIDVPVTGALSSKQRTIPLIAAAAATSNMPQLNAALNRGLDAGLSVSEAKEILVQLYAYVGFPKSLNALGELMTVVEVRKAKGIADAPGHPPRSEIPVGEALRAVGTANQTRISGAPVNGPVMEFAPVINQFLQTHLFGDIFERDNLDWQSRELATVGALAAMPGVEAQLRSHMAASQRVGLSRTQLEHLARLLAHSGVMAASARAMHALEQTPTPSP